MSDNLVGALAFSRFTVTDPHDVYSPNIAADVHQNKHGAVLTCNSPIIPQLFFTYNTTNCSLYALEISPYSNGNDFALRTLASLPLQLSNSSTIIYMTCSYDARYLIIATSDGSLMCYNVSFDINAPEQKVEITFRWLVNDAFYRGTAFKGNITDEKRGLFVNPINTLAFSPFGYFLMLVDSNRDGTCITILDVAANADNKSVYEGDLGLESCMTMDSSREQLIVYKDDLGMEYFNGAASWFPNYIEGDVLKFVVGFCDTSVKNQCQLITGELNTETNIVKMKNNSFVPFLIKGDDEEAEWSCTHLNWVLDDVMLVGISRTDHSKDGGTKFNQFNNRKEDHIAEFQANLMLFTLSTQTWSELFYGPSSYCIPGYTRHLFYTYLFPLYTPSGKKCVLLAGSNLSSKVNVFCQNDNKSDWELCILEESKGICVPATNKNGFEFPTDIIVVDCDDGDSNEEAIILLRATDGSRRVFRVDHGEVVTNITYTAFSGIGGFLCSNKIGLELLFRFLMIVFFLMASLSYISMKQHDDETHKSNTIFVVTGSLGAVCFALSEMLYKINFLTFLGCIIAWICFVLSLINSSLDLLEELFLLAGFMLVFGTVLQIYKILKANAKFWRILATCFALFGILLFLLASLFGHSNGDDHHDHSKHTEMTSKHTAMTSIHTAMRSLSLILFVVNGILCFSGLIVQKLLRLPRNSARSMILEEAKLPEDTFSLMMISKRLSFPWSFGVLICILQFLTVSLILREQIKNSEQSSLFDIPLKVSIFVRFGQLVGIILILISQMDITEPIRMYDVLSWKVSDGNYDLESHVSDTENSRQISDNFLKYQWVKIVRNNVDESELQAKPGRVMFWRIILPIGMKLSEGLLVLLTTLVVILNNDNMIELFQNLTALILISEIDNAAFTVTEKGYMGSFLQEKTSIVKSIKLLDPLSEQVKYKCIGNVSSRTTAYMFIVLTTMSVWSFFTMAQETGLLFHQKYPDCHITNTTDIFKLLGNGECDAPYKGPECGFDLGDCEEYEDCRDCEKDGDCHYSSVIGNDVCNVRAFSEECNWDGGDCSHLVIENLAMKGNVTQSCEFQGDGGNASLATDGNTDGNLRNSSVSRTCNTTASPWWMVELPPSAYITNITIYKCLCKEGLDDTELQIINNEGIIAASRYIAFSADHEKFDFNFTNVGGRYVRVRVKNRRANNILQLSEVEVFGFEFKMKGKP